MTLAIIDSGGANISSIRFALQRLGAEPVFTDDRQTIRNADRVILPGVGAAGAAMHHLHKQGLVQCIRDLRQPVLGICLGMQLLFEGSEEGEMPCLGLIPGQLKKIPASEGIRVPHMGWNCVSFSAQDPLTNDLANPSWFYFVHSYYAPAGPATMATCLHGLTFSAMVRNDNFYGAQFHPERSAGDGAQILSNFLELT